jgi:lipopolysaccharide transport system ATP-binding protein
VSDTVIKLQGISKKYRIRHQRPQRYATLRDTIAEKIKNVFRPSRADVGANAAVEDFWALKDISFEIKRGDVVGIIGRNGAGKSTLLKILSRITEPTTGRVEIDGRVASLLEVGTGFHPELTGRENIYLNGAVMGMSRAEIARKFDEIVAFAEVEKFLDTPVKHFSSGMYVRLAFAVAAHLEPEILIIDEVLAVGDVEFQKKCLGRMGDIASKEGRTVLFVSHHMTSVQSLCQHGIFMEKGQLQYTGKIDDAVTTYLGRIRHENHVNFIPRPGQPSIVAVTVNENELNIGNLIVDIGFVSPFPLVPPVAGVVITSNSGVPVFGSNPRFHNGNYPPKSLKAGTVRMEVRALPLASTNYRLSVWLGDNHVDYDRKEDILSFDFRIKAGVPRRPSSEKIGYLDWSANWRVL